MTSGWQQYPSKSAGYTSTPEWKRLRRRVLKRDGNECQIRGPRCTETATHVDHIINIARGRGDPYDDENCQSACAPCHADKTAHEAAVGRARRSGKRRPRAHPSDFLGGQR